jgi:hypothetical protein
MLLIILVWDAKHSARLLQLKKGKVSRSFSWHLSSIRQKSFLGRAIRRVMSSRRL